MLLEKNVLLKLLEESVKSNISSSLSITVLSSISLGCQKTNEYDEPFANKYHNIGHQLRIVAHCSNCKWLVNISYRYSMIYSMLKTAKFICSFKQELSLSTRLEFQINRNVSFAQVFEAMVEQICIAAFSCKTNSFLCDKIFRCFLLLD